MQIKNLNKLNSAATEVEALRAKAALVGIEITSVRMLFPDKRALTLQIEHEHDPETGELVGHEWQVITAAETTIR